MKKDYKIIRAAIGVDEVKKGVAHVSVPVKKPVKSKGKFQVVGEPWLITSEKEFWPLTAEEQKERNIFVQSLPNFGPVDSRWWDLDIQRFLTWKKHGLDMLEDVYRPVRQALSEHIDFYQDEYVDVVTCWVIGTYLFPAFSAYPYLFLSGPRGSGKTKLLDVIGHMAFNAESTSSITTAGVFRMVEVNQSTLLIDEAETLGYGGKSGQLKLVLNSGYKPGKPATRVNPDSMKIERFLVYSPKAIASINQVNSTLKSRGIEINMIKTSNKKKGNKRVTDNSGDWWSIRDALYRNLLMNVFEIKKFYEGSEKINQLKCRKNELWAPLLAIALFVDEKVYEAISKVARSDSEDEEASIDDWNAALLKGLGEVVGIHKNYQLSAIKKAMLEYLEEDEKERVSSRWVGAGLRRFGFKRGPRKSSGTTYSVDPEVVQDLLIRYQLIKNDEDDEDDEGEDGVEDSTYDEARQVFLSGMS